MKVKPVAEAKTHLNSLIAPGQAEPVVITRNGKPAAVLVPIPEDCEIEDLALVFSPKFRQIIEASRARFDRGEGVPTEEFWKQLDAYYDQKPQAEPARPRKE